MHRQVRTCWTKLSFLVYYLIQLYLCISTEINFIYYLYVSCSFELKNQVKAKMNEWMEQVSEMKGINSCSSQTNSPFLSPSTWQPEDKVIKRKAHYRDSLSRLRTLQGLVQLTESFVLTMRLWYSKVEMSTNKDTIKVRERKRKWLCVIDIWNTKPLFSETELLKTSLWTQLKNVASSGEYWGAWCTGIRQIYTDYQSVVTDAI